MRKLVSGLFMTMDGVVEAPNTWQFDAFDGDMMAALEAHLATEDTVLLGRVTYQEWAPYWPTSTDEPYASHINTVPKVVVSTTLNAAPWGTWNNARVVKAGLKDEISRLKQQSGKNIGVAGSPTLVRSLLQDDLLDELTLMIHPVIAGKGKRLFAGGTGLKRMKLADSKMTGTGVAILTYRPRTGR